MRNEWKNIQADILRVIDQLLSKPKPLQQEAKVQTILWEGKPRTITVFSKLSRLWSLRNSFAHCLTSEDFLFRMNNLDTFIVELNEQIKKAYASEIKSFKVIFENPKKWPPELWRRWSKILLDKYADIDESDTEEELESENLILLPPLDYQRPHQELTFAAVRFMRPQPSPDLKKSDNDDHRLPPLDLNSEGPPSKPF